MRRIGQRFGFLRHRRHLRGQRLWREVGFGNGARAARLGAGIREALGRREACLQRVGSMLTVFFGPGRVRTWADAEGADRTRFAALFS